ncbi:LytTR family transcriptional regulator DNA-binding domain-containing protein [Fulvivirgaceae bacterium BMA10]|uniref:LytTR family transcriptional regulator DNA-binding domain-containing protein n=1 Tax=Splendidivirga corallicola TaxID=3051826 RepID=A0ABT8KS62_9BACT|nr:LytTR family transcriptional regulator DNA-binding domain-containing protein [Fulvivirgaceae bacterium BMA10]
MRRLRILGVEDDVIIAETLKEILKALDYEAVDIVNSASGALAVLETDVEIDLVLLDIQLKGDRDGVELAAMIDERYDLPYIFTTAFADPETIARAKKTSPYGYLVKPYGIKDLHAAIEVALGNFKILQEANILKDQNQFNHDGFFVKVDSRLIRLREDDIMWIEAKGDYAIFKTKEKSYIVHSTMKNIEDKLASKGFFKIHRSYIVNLNKVMDIQDSNLVVGNQVIPVSRRKKDGLLKQIRLL